MKKLPTALPVQTAAAAATPLCRLRKGRCYGRRSLRQVRPRRPQAAAAIAKIMGGEASAVEKKAVVQCQGNSEHCKPSYEYKGIQTCAAAATLYGGPKTCTFACIGLGDCTKVCKFDAIHVVDGVARVDYDKCKGCGMCAQKCPKHIILFPLKDDPNPPQARGEAGSEARCRSCRSGRARRKG